MSAANDGDRRALEVLLGRHHDRVFGLCRRLTGNDADAADACQEALIAIVRGLARFDGRALFTTWAYRVATNACLDELRRRRRRPEPGLPEHDLVPAGRGTGEVSASAGSLAERIDIDSAMSSLAHEFRVAVVLRDQCGLAYEEIAEVVGVPIGTVRSRISRGRAMLADRLGESYGPGNGHTTKAAREPTTVPLTSKLKQGLPMTMTAKTPASEDTKDQ